MPSFLDASNQQAVHGAKANEDRIEMSDVLVCMETTINHSLRSTKLGSEGKQRVEVEKDVKETETNPARVKARHRAP
jgi:hypothetical protein